MVECINCQWLKEKDNPRLTIGIGFCSYPYEHYDRKFAGATSETEECGLNEELKNEND